MAKKRLARLRPAEYKAWLWAWWHALDVGKQGQDRAALRAWRDIKLRWATKEGQPLFPRLRRFGGCVAPEGGVLAVE